MIKMRKTPQRAKSTCCLIQRYCMIPSKLPAEMLGTSLLPIEELSPAVLLPAQREICSSGTTFHGPISEGRRWPDERAPFLCASSPLYLFTACSVIFGFSFIMGALESISILRKLPFCSLLGMRFPTSFAMLCFFPDA